MKRRFIPKMAVVALSAGVMMSGSVMTQAAENTAQVQEAVEADEPAGAAQCKSYTQEELEAITETTVFKDENSATGYSVKFCFTDPDFGTENEAQRVRLYGEWGFSDPASSTIWTGEYASPWEWQDGYTLWFGTHTAPYYDMEKGENGLWSLVVPLPTGGYKYRFYIGGDVDADANDTTGCYMSYDQSNKPALSDVEKDPYQLSAHTYFTSYIFVPWDSEKQANTDRVDELCPVAEGEGGEVFFEKTTIQQGDFTGKESNYGIYLPNGFDPDREEGYPILVMVHGGGESEPAWFNSGLVEILDNMIAEGRMEPTIVVTPSMNDFDRTDGQNMKHDYDRVALDDFISQQLLPYMEENYNVSTDKEKHAIGGCSNGGTQTWVAYFNHNEDYKYYIPLSGAEPAQSMCDIDYTREELKDDVVMIGISLYDNAGWNLDLPELKGAYLSVYNMAQAGLPFKIVNGIPYGHGYPGWRIELIKFFDEYLWKVDAEEPTEPAVTPLETVTYSDKLTGEQLYAAALLYREKEDFATGITFMHEALARGCDNALVEMAAWYFADKVPMAEGEDNNEEALKLMELATERDIDKAIECFEKSIELGYNKAYKFLGDMYAKGEYGVEADQTKAAEYYKMGADAKDFTCTHLYADCLYNGNGVEQNPEEAIAMYQWLVDVQAHNKNDYAWGAYMLGKVYEEGIYVEKDEEQSKAYYELAVSLGSKDAEEALNK